MHLDIYPTQPFSSTYATSSSTLRYYVVKTDEPRQLCRHIFAKWFAVKHNLFLSYYIDMLNLNNRYNYNSHIYQHVLDDIYPVVGYVLKNHFAYIGSHHELGDITDDFSVVTCRKCSLVGFIGFRVSDIDMKQAGLERFERIYEVDNHVWIFDEIYEKMFGEDSGELSELLLGLSFKYLKVVYSP